MFKKTLLVALAAMLFSMIAVPAQAGIWSGACLVDVHVTFNSPVRLTDTHPSYSLSMGSFLPNTCAVSLDPLNPIRSTGGGGNGTSSLFTCDAAVASGGWSQVWTNSSGTSNPPPVSGSHVLTGTWDNWVLTATNPSLSYTGVAYLKLAPFDQLKTAQCATGSISSLAMVGVMYFQDPS